MAISAELLITVSELVVGSVLLVPFRCQLVAIQNEIFFGHAELRSGEGQQISEVNRGTVN